MNLLDLPNFSVDFASQQPKTALAQDNFEWVDLELGGVRDPANNLIYALLSQFLNSVPSMDDRLWYVDTVRHALHAQFMDMIHEYPCDEQGFTRNPDMKKLMQNLSVAEYASRLLEGVHPLTPLDIFLFSQCYQVNVWLWLPGCVKPLVMFVQNIPDAVYISDFGYNHCHIGLNSFENGMVYTSVVFQHGHNDQPLEDIDIDIEDNSNRKRKISYISE
eukprot:TRINITY_DN19247_c0_g1_i16.p1 TRINITY_DN19247_c0_g1~~TRINITY_DN19247_c0_g1_i16.p1  ORF type:complete len:218 (-),score=32.55 TRINITY_DN19247_c0_g1_i16:159-812(-)